MPQPNRKIAGPASGIINNDELIVLVPNAMLHHALIAFDPHYRAEWYSRNLTIQEAADCLLAIVAIDTSGQVVFA